MVQYPLEPRARAAFVYAGCETDPAPAITARIDSQENGTAFYEVFRNVNSTGKQRNGRMCHLRQVFGMLEPRAEHDSAQDQ